MRKPIFLTLTFGATLMLSACINNSDEPVEAQASNNASVASVKPTSNSSDMDSSSSEETFTNGTLKTPRYEIKITKNKVILPGKKGNEYGKKPVIAFWYDITNKSDEEVSPMDFLFVFNAYQDNNPNAFNKLEVGSLPDDAFLETQMENIKRGGTVKNAIAYELDDMKTPVDLVASTGLGATEIGRVTYQIK